MAERTVTINGLSKTYSVTGWRVGWTISPPSLTGAIRKVHDFLTVGARRAAAGSRRRRARRCRTRYYRDLAARYQRRRDMLLEHPRAASLHVLQAVRRVLHHDRHQRASALRDDVEFARYLIKDVGVAAVPGSSFYKNSANGRRPSCVSASASGRDAARSRSADGEARPRRRVQLSSTATTARLEQPALKYRARPARRTAPFSVNVAAVGVERVADVERAIPALHADVVGEVQRAVDVESR